MSKKLIWGKDLGCYTCKNYQGMPKGIHSCRAFPKGIPFLIKGSDADHRLPFEGDGGIMYEGMELDKLV